MPQGEDRSDSEKLEGALLFVAALATATDRSFDETLMFLLRGWLLRVIP